MKNHPKEIDQFVAKVRHRLNRFQFLDTLIWSSLVCASILTIACLVYILRGYAVPKPLFMAAGGVAVLGGLAVWACRLWNGAKAAHYADDFFDLKDSLTTTLEFRKEHREGDFVALQEKVTASKIEDKGAQAIRYRWPTRILGMVALLAGACALMSFKEASPKIVEQQLIEAETDKKTAEINEFLEEMIEELEKNASDEEKEILDPDKLKEWVKELDQTKDRKEAMRQYAQLERKLQEAARRLDQRKNEQLLTKAGVELQKDAENRALGKKMEDKKFREAAADLEKMKPSEIGNKKMSEHRKELAKLKSAAQRMAAAAKAANRKSSSSANEGNKNSQSGKSQQANNGKNSQSKSGENSSGSKSSGSQGGGEIDSEMAALEKSLSDLDKALQNAELQEKQLGKCDAESLSECKNCQNKALSDLDKLCKSMCKTASKSECKSKLMSMCKSMGQCQGYLGMRQCNSLSQCMGTKPGGKNAGNGSVESRRNEMDLLTDNGNTTQLKGIQGQGPSQSTIEAAEEGSGVSNRRVASRKIEFSRQVESFVQREDVPEDVKQGVKAYFENIHQE